MIFTIFWRNLQGAFNNIETLFGDSLNELSLTKSPIKTVRF
jgi:hypothetical protein